MYEVKSRSCRNDPEIATLSIQNDVNYLIYVSKEIQNDKEIVIEATKNCSESKKNLASSPLLREDKLALIVNCWPCAIELLVEILKALTKLAKNNSITRSVIGFFNCIK